MLTRVSATLYRTLTRVSATLHRAFPCVPPGEVSRVQEEAQREAVEAGTEREVLEERLKQAERSHKLSLSSREKIHREQLLAQQTDAVRPPAPHGD